jgi:hypothetical protein
LSSDGSAAALLIATALSTCRWLEGLKSEVQGVISHVGYSVGCVIGMGLQAGHARSWLSLLKAKLALYSMQQT